MADKKPPVDQDALAAEWGMAIESDGPAKPRPAANPRRMSGILGQMSSKAAERLTVGLPTARQRQPSATSMPATSRKSKVYRRTDRPMN
jgi:hypothetical protein